MRRGDLRGVESNITAARPTIASAEAGNVIQFRQRSAFTTAQIHRHGHKRHAAAGAILARIMTFTTQ
jgi:hypothetical protein